MSKVKLSTHGLLFLYRSATRFSASRAAYFAQNNCTGSHGPISSATILPRRYTEPRISSSHKARRDPVSRSVPLEQTLFGHANLTLSPAPLWGSDMHELA